MAKMVSSKVVALGVFGFAIAVFGAVALTISLVLGGRAPVLNIGNGTELVASADRGTANVRTLGSFTGLQYTSTASVVNISTVPSTISATPLTLYSSNNVQYVEYTTTNTQTFAGVDENGVVKRTVRLQFQCSLLQNAAGLVVAQFILPIKTYNPSQYANVVCNAFWNGAGGGPMASLGDTYALNNANGDILMIITAQVTIAPDVTGYFRCTADYQLLEN